MAVLVVITQTAGKSIFNPLRFRVAGGGSNGHLRVIKLDELGCCKLRIFRGFDFVGLSVAVGRG